jgi:enoyl-CoA hydratase/carnithine racemase
MNDEVKLARQENLAIVALNRPDSLNAVNRAMREALIATLRQVNTDDAVRAVVITGIDEWLTRQHAMYQSVRDLDKPCIVAWNGVAAGAGYQIGLCADLRVGYPELKLGQPEIKAGLASIVGSYLMTLQLPLSLNQQLSITGDLIDGQRGYDIGLVNYLVAREEVLAKAVAVAGELTRLGATALRLTKRRFRELTQPGFDAALIAAKEIQKEAYRSGEPQAAMRRFFAARSKK